MGFVSRIVLLAAAAGLVLAAVLPWVTIKGITLDLGPISVEVPVGGKTVHGTDTALWPVILVVAAIVAVLGLLGVARKVVLALGLAVVVGGGALLYYLSNVIEIETRDSSRIEQALAQALITSSVGPGAPLLIASGIAIVVGALLAR